MTDNQPEKEEDDFNNNNPPSMDEEKEDFNDNNEIQEEINDNNQIQEEIKNDNNPEIPEDKINSPTPENEFFGVEEKNNPVNEEKKEEDKPILLDNIVDIPNNVDENKIEENKEQVKDNIPLQITAEERKKMEDDLDTKNSFIEKLEKINLELKQKLESYEEKYKSMYDQVELEKSNSKAYQMNFQIKEIDNKINQLSKETKKYKNKYEQLKSKFNLIENVENKMNANQILKEELAKQKNLKMVYDSLKKENLNQIRLLNYIEGKNRNEEKILFLQNEVKGARSKLKAEQERYLKREKFLKLIHERIYSIENNLKSLNVKKKEIVSKEKNFTLEDLKNNLDKLMKLQGEINLKNEQNKSYSKNYKIKLHYNLCENKKLEDNYKALVGKQRILQQERNSTRNRILITEKKLGVGKSLININVNKRYSPLESDFISRNYYNPIKKNKSSIFPEYLEKLV